MASYLTDKPFHGIKQAKYEMLLESNPEWVGQATKEELEGYLDEVQERWMKRGLELMPSTMASLGCTEELKATDWMEYVNRLGQAERTAQEIAWEEEMRA